MNPTTIQVEARTNSRWAGKCKRCKGDIAQGAPIAKVDGQWVCDTCATIPSASSIDAPAPPTPEPTPPVPTAVPTGAERPMSARDGESVEELHARVWRFAVVQAAHVPEADARERRITALAFYKALMAAEIARS